MSKNKHLTDAERLQIEQGLANRMSIKKIAETIGKSPSTISREIRHRAVISNKSAPFRIHNRCVQRFSCSVRFLCMDKPDCTTLCRSCKHCNNLCPSFEEDICSRLFVPPYVCNGCLDESRCVLRKKYYLHHNAHCAYRKELSSVRAGINISQDELLWLDAFVSPLIKNGQSVHHIFANNPDEFSISEKSVYRYVAGGLLKARNLDMPRVCRFKPRTTKPLEHKVDAACRVGRSYEDYQTYLGNNNAASAVEMDSVVGRIGGKVLLTLMFKSCDLMLAFIRDRNTSQSVIDVFSYLCNLLGIHSFCALFPVILTDNGSEFSNPSALEQDANGVCRTRIFYCDPRACYQKPNVELNHEFIRKILPKGRSFDGLSQCDVNLMMSHINSYSREKLNNKTPFDVFSFLYGRDILEKLGLCKVPPNEIILKPILLNK